MVTQELSASVEFDSTLELVESIDFKQTLNRALVVMGKRNVHKQYRHLWSPEKPYLGYCYVVTELLYHLLDKKALPKVLPTKEGKHWFLELPDCRPLDLTTDAELDYSLAKRSSFLTKEMSARTRSLAELMEMGV